MTQPPLAAIAAQPQLTAEHLGQLATARLAARKVRRAVSVATMDGWMLGLSGGITLMIAIVSRSGTGLLIGLGLSTIAVVELYAAKKLAQLEPRASKTLGLNQVVLAALITLYALTQIYTYSNASATGTGDPDADEFIKSNPEIADTVQSMTGTVKQVATGVYMLVIAFTVLTQGGLALYYFSRIKHVNAYLEQTPEWIIAMQKSGVPI